MASLAGIINLHEPDELIRELTRHRSLAAVPFGGRYRLIDFTLSNMVNAGIRNVGSLIDKYGPPDHLKTARNGTWTGAKMAVSAASRSHHGPGHTVTGDIPNSAQPGLHQQEPSLSRSQEQYICNLTTGTSWTTTWQRGRLRWCTARRLAHEEPAPTMW